MWSRVGAHSSEHCKCEQVSMRHGTGTMRYTSVTWGTEEYDNMTKKINDTSTAQKKCQCQEKLCHRYWGDTQEPKETRANQEAGWLNTYAVMN